MSLTPEDRRRIYEEEKARIEAQTRLQRERISPLENAIEPYLREGFRVVSRTETSVQLIKPRRYNPTFGCLGFLTFGVFWVLGLLDFLLQKDRLVYLSLDANGAVLVDNKTPRRIAQERADMTKGWVVVGGIVLLIILAVAIFGR